MKKIYPIILDLNSNVLLLRKTLPHSLYISTLWGTAEFAKKPTSPVK